MNTKELKNALRPVLVIVLVWTVLCAIGALGNYADALQRPNPISYGDMLWRWWRAHVLEMVFSCVVYAWFLRQPALLSGWRPLALRYVAAIAVFLPLEMLYVNALEGRSITQASGFNWFLEYAWTTFAFVTVVGVCNARHSRAREKAWLRAQTENLGLRLELEQQRILALRGQLNPHFLFNALNAISALVRSSDGKLALAGISHLSDLLRYALQASERDHVSLADECRFVDDYLALQKLRYGERLQVGIEGACDGQIPPLLLQPLIENALRHDLDCHDQPSDIRLAFGGDEERLTIHVSNPVSAGSAPNPGLGLGLRHSRARLHLAYGDAATLSAGVEDGRFMVGISMPRYALAA